MDKYAKVGTKNDVTLLSVVDLVFHPAHKPYNFIYITVCACILVARSVFIIQMMMMI